MNNVLRGGSSRASLTHSLMFVGAYIAAASVVSWSAYAAKQSHLMPALAAVESHRVAPVSDEQPTPDAALETIIEVQPASQVPIAISPDASSPVVTEPVSDEIRYFNGRAVRPAKTYWMTVTGYSPDERSCGKWADGITASNKSVWTNAMQLVAADTRILPFGSLLTIEGYADDKIVPVEDRGGAIKGMRLDLLYPTHEEALQWGVQRLPVTVWEYVEG